MVRRLLPEGPASLKDNNGLRPDAQAGHYQQNTRIHRSSNPWETSKCSGLVSIGTHRLWISTSGPPRQYYQKHGRDTDMNSAREHETQLQPEPVFVMCTGGGAPCATYVRVQRYLAKAARVYFYDRAGYDRSERGQVDVDGNLDANLDADVVAPAPTLGLGSGEANATTRSLDFNMSLLRMPWSPLPSKKGAKKTQTKTNKNNSTILATDSATELFHLLREGIQIPPPYILIGHSYGGIIARTFLELYPTHTAGLIMADSGVELLYAFLAPDLTRVMPPIVAGLDLTEVMGYRRTLRLTDEELATAFAATERSEVATQDEDNRGSAKSLAEKKQLRNQTLHNKPLSVVICNFAADLQKQFDAGVKKGNGTETERKEAEELIEKFRLYFEQMGSGQARLSNMNRVVYVDDMGHMGILEKPEILVKEVKWTLEQWRKLNGYM